MNVWASWRSPSRSASHCDDADDVERTSRSFESEGTGPLTSNVAEGGAFVRTRAGPRRAGHPAPRVPAMLLDEESSASGEHGDLARRLPAHADEPRSAYLDRTGPDGQAAHLSPLLRHRRGHGEHGGGPRLVMEITASRRCALLRGDCAAGVRLEERPAAYIRRHAQTLYHPVGTCAMGGGRRRRAARARHRGPAGRRRLGDADRPAREHERADDHDRRARRGPDPRPVAADGGDRRGGRLNAAERSRTATLAAVGTAERRRNGRLY